MSLPTHHRILVTGGAGYVGSHAVHCLVKNGVPPENVIVFDNLVYGHREFLPAGVVFHQGDLLCKEEIARVFQRYPIDDVLHFAAYAFVGESMAMPGKYFENNIMGGINLLETMARFDCRRIIFSSSCAAYGLQSGDAITEEAPSEPINPYGESKLQFERMLSWYHRIHRINSISLRYFNAGGADFGIGERHDPEPHVIPRLIATAIQQKSAFTVYGKENGTPDGTCIRDYIHVADLAAAHCSAIDYLNDKEICQVINLGSGKGTSVLEMVHQLEDIVGVKIPVQYLPPRPGDPPVLIAAGHKAAQLLGWRPKRSMAEILQSAWTWHLQEQKTQQGDNPQPMTIRIAARG